jgi:hypothetical protein
MRLLKAWMIVVAACGVTVGDEGSRELAAKIDARLDEAWKTAEIQPAAQADDGEFLRRVSLDLVGKIPTAAEARDFLDDPDPNKRRVLVDRLLDSPAYAARAALLWRQLLLPETETGGQVAAGGLESWLRKKVREEAGYDRIAREVLSARLGDDPTEMTEAASETSPAAFYTARDGKPEVLAGDAARVFLGIRVECAQCHNHPFAKWKREEFWGFAAFFADVPAQTDDGVNTPRPSRDRPERRELTIPGTSTVVKATHLDHSNPSWRPRATSRQVLADWITSPENPYFARAAANRAWARFFGNGLIDPVDDLDAEGDPALAALLDEIAAAFRTQGYDLKFLIRALTATKAYNRSSAADPNASAGPSYFSVMPVRGLSPAQFVDSLSQAVGTDLGPERARFLDLFSERDVPPTESQTTILQALTLMNGSFIASATDTKTGNVLGALAEAPYLDTAQRVEFAFLAVLTRRPRPEEQSLAVRYIDRQESAGDRARALSDLFWALLNGPEFRTNH